MPLISSHRWRDQRDGARRKTDRLYRRLDQGRRIEFVDLANKDAACPIDRAEMLARFHAMEKGRLLSGAAAFAAMWRAIPILLPFGMIAQLPLVDRLLERGYRHFLRFRPRLQRWFE